MNPAESVAWTMAAKLPVVVGVPVTVPDDGSSVSPAGREPEVTAQPVMVAPPPAPEVVASSVSGARATAASSVCSPGSVTDTVFATVQSNSVEPLAPSESVAVTVTA